MGWRGKWIAPAALVCCAAQAVRGQSQPVSETLDLSAKSAVTWTADGASVVELNGPVKIQLDHATATADGAVVWLSAVDPDDLDIQAARIALIGHADLKTGLAGRGGNRLFVNAIVRSQGIRISADDRAARDDSNSALYREAGALKLLQPPPPAPPATRAGPVVATLPTTRPRKQPSSPPNAIAPIDFEARNLQTTTADDGTVAIVLTDGVKLAQSRPNNDFIELSADRAVLYTSLKNLRELAQSGGRRRGREIIVAAYLEGDVRIDFVGARPGTPEQRLTANRVYYEFATDRAVLTDAIVHTTDPLRQLPLIARSRAVRQLSQGEFDTQGTQLSTSYFAVPSYSLAADKLYLRTEPTGDPNIGDQVYFRAQDVSLQAFDVPFFFWPGMSGEMSRGLPLRGLGGGNSHDFGAFFNSVWGLFETAGQLPPRDIDVNYRLDYFSKRGPAAGLNASYGGGFLADADRKPTDFTGQFRSYFVYDSGRDTLGDVYRTTVRNNEESTLRGQVLWEHQQFFPDNWQAQARLGWTSDATFMEQWFRNDFQDGSPRDIVGYLKHQDGSEAFTVGVVWQPSNLVTTSNQQQEQFEVDRLPEAGYFREGEDLGDVLTLYSENTGEGLHFSKSRDTLIGQGFVPPNVAPGLPAQGYTGQTSRVVFRADSRQELDFPMSAGPLRVDPYVVGRYTQYSDSPHSSEVARGLVGAGARFTTELWKVDPTFENNLLDLHQIRHVIEPEINLFTSAMNVQRNDVFVFDPEVDAISDISAAQFALHQRWQTKRGGPGNWRSVDVFSLNLEVNTFANKPPHKGATNYINPYDFRGLYFASYPEESVTRNSFNADASWRLNDNTVLLGDMTYNLDRGNLQTLSVGALVRRDERLSYFIGNRYIADLASNITSVHLDYQFSPKYTFDVDQEFDFTQGKNVYSSLAILRTFDTFVMAVRYYYDETTSENSFSFNIFPIGLGYGVDSGQFNQYHR